MLDLVKELYSVRCSVEQIATKIEVVFICDMCFCHQHNIGVIFFGGILVFPVSHFYSNNLHLLLLLGFENLDYDFLNLHKVMHNVFFL